MPKLTNPYLLTSVYFILSLIGILNHEIWLDEAQSWLLAKDSESILGLIKNTKHEGHPILWNAMIHFITRFTANPFWMQFFHIIISTSVIFIFLKHAPFKTLFKILFIFGYYTLFEYNLLSRNYMLGVLFIFLACSLYKHKKEKFIYFTFFLAVASNVHAIFIILASSLMFLEFYEFFKYKKFKFNKKYVLGWSIFITGISLAIIQIFPPTDNIFYNSISEISLNKKFTHGILSLFKSLIMIPDFRSINFWNSNLLINLSKPLTVVFIVFTYILPFFLFNKNKTLLLFMYIGIIGANLFFYVTQLSSLRYDGLLYILFITALWIDNYHKQDKSNDLTLKIPQKTIDKIKKISIYTILILHFLSGIISYTLDILLPFDSSKNTVAFIKKENLLNEDIVTISCEGTTLTAYTGINTFSLCLNDYKSYCDWQKSCKMDNLLNNEVDRSIANYINLKKKNIVFISHQPLLDKTQKGKIENKYDYRLIKKFEGSILKMNDYYIYEISNN